MRDNNIIQEAIDCLKRLHKENAELKAENARLKEDKIGLHSEIKQLEQENFELKESLKCFQTPEAIKALTFYKTGEFELQEKKCIELEQENERLKEEFEIETLTDKISGETVYRSCVALRLADTTNRLTQKCVNYKQTLQEIKEIAEQILNKNEFIYMNYRDVRQIIRLITKAESEG